jgi:hypothetical protein
MGFSNFNRLFNDERTGILRPAVVPKATPAILDETNVVFVDTQYLILSILPYTDALGSDASAVAAEDDNIDAEDPRERGGSIAPLTFELLVTRMINFINNLLVDRPNLSHIVFGADTHTNVPLMKHMEWNARSQYTSNVMSDTYSRQLKTDYSRADDTLVYGLQGVLSPDMLKDRYTRPLLLSTLFEKVAASYQYVGDIEEGGSRSFTLLFLHPIFSMTTGLPVEKENAYEFTVEEDTRTTSVKTFYTRPLDIGEADIQLLFFMDDLVRNQYGRAMQVEVVSNDTDTYIILLFFYFHMSVSAQGLDQLQTYVWGSGKGQLVDINRLFTTVIPYYISDVFKDTEVEFNERTLFFLVFCLLFYQTDYYEKPANFGASPEQLDKCMRALATIKEVTPSGTLYILFKYGAPEFSATPVEIEFDAVMMRRLSQGMFLLILPPVAGRRNKGATDLPSLGREVLSGKGNGVTLKVLDTLWREFVDNVGLASQSENIRREHPLYKVVEDSALLGTIVLHDIIGERQLKSLTLLLLHAFRDESNEQLYESDHPGRKIDEPSFVFGNSATGRIFARWLKEEEGLETFIDETEHTDDYKTAWRIYDTQESVAGLTRAKTFPGDLATEHHFFKVGKVMWLATYFNSGFLLKRNYEDTSKLPTKREKAYDTIEGLVAPGDGAPYTFDVLGNRQLEPLLRIAGFRIIKDEFQKEPVKLVRQEDASLARAFMADRKLEKVVVNTQKALLVHRFSNRPVSDFAPLLRATGLFLFEPSLTGVLSPEGEKVRGLMLVYRDEMVALTNHLGAAWIKTFLGRLSAAGGEVDERLMFKRMLAEFFIERDRSEANFYLQPVPCWLDLAGPEMTRFMVPTMRLSASELDSGVDVELNSMFSCSEYKLGVEFDAAKYTTFTMDKNELKPLLPAKMRDKLKKNPEVVNRGVLFTTETAMVSGLVAEVAYTPVVSEDDAAMVRVKNWLTTAPYYLDKMLYGANHGFITPREMRNVLLPTRLWVYAAMTETEFFHVAVDTEWHSRFYDSIISTSLDVCTYAVPLLRYKYDVHTRDIWEHVVVPNLSLFRHYMQQSYLSYIDFQMSAPTASVPAVPAQSYVPDMRLMSASWPMAILRYFGAARDFNINDQAPEPSEGSEERTAGEWIREILESASDICMALCMAMPSAKNIFVMLDKSEDAASFKITLMFRGWDTPSLGKYLNWVLNHVSDSTALSMQFGDYQCPINIIILPK